MVTRFYRYCDTGSWLGMTTRECMQLGREMAGEIQDLENALKLAHTEGKVYKCYFNEELVFLPFPPFVGLELNYRNKYGEVNAVKVTSVMYNITDYDFTLEVVDIP